MDQLKQQYRLKKAWGLSCSIDLYDCNYDLITKPQPIKQFVTELATILKVKRHGPCQLTNYGGREGVYGFSMVQLIDASLISGHFSNASRAAYLDIFSCKYYDPKKAAAFSQGFFQAKKYKLNITLRINP